MTRGAKLRYHQRRRRFNLINRPGLEINIYKYLKI